MATGTNEYAYNIVLKRFVDFFVKKKNSFLHTLYTQVYNPLKVEPDSCQLDKLKSGKLLTIISHL